MNRTRTLWIISLAALLLSAIVVLQAKRPIGRDSDPTDTRSAAQFSAGTKTARDSSAQTSPGERADQILSLQHNEAQANAWNDFIMQLKPEQFPDIAKQLAARDPRTSTTLHHRQEALFQRWGEIDPQAALEHAGQSWLGQIAMEAWIRSDTEAALAWVRLHPHTHFVDMIFEAIARQDMNRAIQLAHEKADDEWTQRAAQGILPILAEQSGPEAIRQWISGFPDETMKFKLMRHLVESRHVGNDPAATLAWLETAPSAHADPIRHNLIQALGKQDAPAALAYFDALPESRKTVQAFHSILTGIAANDPRAAIRLLDQNPDRIEDHALSRVISAGITIDAAYVMTLLPRIKDDARRLRARNSTLRQWLSNDPPAAQTWMQAQGITTSDIQPRIAPDTFAE